MNELAATEGLQPVGQSSVVLDGEELRERLESLPPTPGCYVFRDREGKVLYVGKAKSLRSRVRSYFQEGSSDSRAFLPALRRLLGGLETYVTQTEKEAAILENSLIKECRPRFNVKLRDDKEFLTLRLDPGQQWPRLRWVRRPQGDRARYFGPYHSASQARKTLQLVEKQFQLRTCTDREMASRSRPCLQYQIKRCLAPCVYPVDQHLYSEQVRAVTLFLEGRHDELSAELTDKMSRASAELQFELAANYRDQLRAIESIRQQQRVVEVSDRNQDVLGLYREGDSLELAVLYLRGGRVVQVATYSQSRMQLPNCEVVAGYLREHYGPEGLAAQVPDEILVPELPEGEQGIGEWLTAQREGRRTRAVRLLAPSRGPRAQLLKMAMENAQHAFEEKRRAKRDVGHRLARVQEKLRLPTVPNEIECIDISHQSGQDTFGSIVALSEGVPNKKKYRSFRVKAAAASDDYGAIYEVLSRRFIRGRSAPSRDAAEGEVAGEAAGTPWALPDLLVVDGGKGQLAVALAAAADLGLHELCLVGLAKERENSEGDTVVERIYLPGQKNPVTLGPHAPELFLLAMARDEAHRFANKSRARAGKKRRLASQLDDVPGVGPKTRSSLQRHVGGVDSIRRASDDTLLSVPGIGPSQVRALREHLGDLPSRDQSSAANAEELTTKPHPDSN